MRSSGSCIGTSSVTERVRVAVTASYRRMALRYQRCDFTVDGAEQRLLRVMVGRLSFGQRLCWETRFCGITRSYIGGDYQEYVGRRLSVEEAADALDIGATELNGMCRRAAAHLDRWLNARDGGAGCCPEGARTSQVEHRANGGTHRAYP